jgi:hypothetical protein
VLPAAGGDGAVADDTSAAAAAAAAAIHALHLEAPAASPGAVAAAGGCSGAGRPHIGSEAAASSSSAATQPQVVANTDAVGAATFSAATGAGSSSQEEVEGVEEGMCVVCWAAKRRVLLLPCRHLCCCRHCSVVLQAQGAPCPMCRQDVREHMEVYV